MITDGLVHARQALVPPSHTPSVSYSLKKCELGTYCVLSWLAATKWWAGTRLPGTEIYLRLYLFIINLQTGNWALDSE